MTPLTPGHARGGFAAVAMALALPAWAAGPAPDRTSIENTYQRERAACESIAVPESRTSCLRDAGAARAEALRGKLGTGQTAEDRARNALARCKVHAPEDQARCERMVRGEGTVSGSVAGGGQLRELVTQERVPSTRPAPPPAQQQVTPPVPAAPPPVQRLSPPVHRMSPPVQQVTPPVQPLTPPVEPVSPPVQPVQPPPPMPAR